MGDEIELVSDGNGLVVLGESGAVDRFLTSQDLATVPSRPLATETIGKASGTAGRALQSYGEVASQSGRWLKMTEDSARKVRELGGLTATKTPGVSHAMIGKPGASKSWIQVVSGPGNLATTFTNPAALASIGSLMAQQQMQQSIDELKEYLAQIDEKVDDILRAQKDAVLADMIGVDLLVEEAMTVREQVGHVSDVTWSKVQASAGTIARTQAYALRQLDALAEKLELKSDMGDLVKATRESEAKVREWLAVIARCFQLQEALGVLELDRVSDSATADLDKHRIGLQAVRQNRLNLIGRSCDQLIERMDLASAKANQKVLLNPFESPRVVSANNNVVTAIVEFERRLELTTGREAAEARRWLAALVDTRDHAVEFTLDGVDAAKRLAAGGLDKAGALKEKALDVGGDGFVKASEATGKLFGGLADKARRLPRESDSAETD